MADSNLRCDQPVGMGERGTSSSHPIGTGGSQHWRPIFNDDVEEEENFSLRQIHPCDERLSVWKGKLEACLRRASLLQQDADGPYSGREKSMESCVLMRSCPGLRVQSAHADFDLVPPVYA